MTPEMIQTLIGLLTPLVVYGVTEIVKITLPAIKGWGIVAIVVPALGFAATLVTNLVTTAGPAWYVQFGLSLLAVFVNEMLRQVKQGNA